MAELLRCPIASEHLSVSSMYLIAFSWPLFTLLSILKCFLLFWFGVFRGFFSTYFSHFVWALPRTLPSFYWVFSVDKADLRCLGFKLLLGLLAAKKHRKLLKSWLEKIQVKRGLWPHLGCNFEHADSTQASTWKALQRVRPSDIAWYNFVDWRKHFTYKKPLRRRRVREQQEKKNNNRKLNELKCNQKK